MNYKFILTTVILEKCVCRRQWIELWSVRRETRSASRTQPTELSDAPFDLSPLRNQIIQNSFDNISFA